MFKRIDHIELVTADEERALRFYTEVLGFSVRSRFTVPGGLKLVYLDLGGTTVELMTWTDTKPAPRAEGEHLGYRMMAIEVDDMQAALDVLKAKGVACTWGPLVRPGYARAEIRDPDGNSIELRQWIDPTDKVDTAKVFHRPDTARASAALRAAVERGFTDDFMAEERGQPDQQERPDLDRAAE